VITSPVTESGLPKIRKIVDLGHELWNGMPNLGANVAAFWPQETHQLTRASSKNRVSYTSRMILVNEHIGTHLDVPVHFYEPGDSVEKIPLTKLILPGHMLDLTHRGPGEAITIADFEQAEAKSGRPIGPGYAIIARTGAEKVWAQGEFWAERPYIPVETGQWLIDKKIDLFATDLIGMDITEVKLPPDASPADREEAEGFWWPFHTLMLTAGISMIQQLCNLDQLVGEEEFLLVALPLKMRDGTGSPIRPVALVF
jgi:kynurenine formamidase